MLLYHLKIPEYTSNADALGSLRILDSIIKLDKKIKFYQAGSSEMFGRVQSFLKMKRHLFIQGVHMVFLKFTRIG